MIKFHFADVFVKFIKIRDYFNCADRFVVQILVEQKATLLRQRSRTVVADELKNEIPFSTKEPENFQAEISVTTDGIEDKTFTARNQCKSFNDFRFSKKDGNFVFENRRESKISD